MKEQIAAKIETVDTIRKYIEYLEEIGVPEADKAEKIKKYLSSMKINYKDTLELIKKMTSM